MIPDFVWDFFVWSITGIYPSRRNLSDPERLYRWMRSVALSMYFWAGATVIVTSLAFGFVPGYRGFALADDMNNINTTLQQILSESRSAHITTIDTNIQTTRAHECLLEKTPNPVQDEIDQDRGKINALREEYYRLTGQLYATPTCDQL